VKAINDAEIEAIKIQRDRLEVQLANALLSKFEGNSLWEVKSVCRALLTKIRNNLSRHARKAIVDNNWLRMWKVHPPKPANSERDAVDAHLERLFRHSIGWTPEDCSDIIRLYGEIVEADPHFESEAIYKSTFWGSKSISMDKKGKVRGEVVHDVAFATGGVTHSGQKFGFRARERIEQNLPPAPHFVAERYGPGITGITKSKLAEYDSVKKIDDMFALPEGASISGTTADSIYACTIATSKSLTGWLHLLPIATMVSQYHHTVLECALTLTLNKKVRYHIGFYESLAPLIGPYPREVEDVLSTFERRAVDSGLVVFAWTNKGVRKGLVLGPDDEAALMCFRKLAEVTDEHMRVWRVMGANNNVGPAWELWNKHVTGLGREATKVLLDSGLQANAEARYGIRGGGMPRPKVDVTR
jgi:hypothetical protein